MMTMIMLSTVNAICKDVVQSRYDLIRHRLPNRIQSPHHINKTNVALKSKSSYENGGWGCLLYLNSNARTIVVMHGDQTGEELLQEALRLLVPDVIGVTLDFQHHDLSLEKRRSTKNGVVKDASAAMLQSGLGMKAATITPPDPNDVGSPNALLREQINGTVILRTGRRLPRVRPVGGVHDPISIVRMAVDDAYGAKEWRESTPGGDEIAYRTSKISRSVCRSVAEFSFLQAERTNARVFGGPKYTVSPVYEGMFKEELDAAAARHPHVVYAPQLIDATLALLLKSDGDAMVIPTLNRDGDLLSDMVLQMFGSIAGSESQVIAFRRIIPYQGCLYRGPAWHRACAAGQEHS